MKILIVDDEPLIRRALSRAFKARGHEVVEAEDGEVAFQLWPGLQPDLAMIDMLMPRRSGLELVRAIDRGKSKIILMSAYMSDKSLQEEAEKVADQFISKPFHDIQALTQMCEELVK